MLKIIEFFENNDVESHTFSEGDYSIYVERLDNGILWLEYLDGNELTGTTKIIGGYVRQLPHLTQKAIRHNVVKALKALGYEGEELETLTSEAMDSKLEDLEELLEGEKYD